MLNADSHDGGMQGGGASVYCYSVFGAGHFGEALLKLCYSGAINLGGYLSSLEPLSVVPVKMDLVDADRALDAMLDTLVRRGKPAS